MNEESGVENVDLTDFSQQDESSSKRDDDSSPKQDADSRPAQPATGGESKTAAGEGKAASEDDQPSASDLEAVFDVPVNITAVLGGTNMEVSDLLKLDEGDVVELDRKVGEAIDIFVNNRLVARGEVVLVEDRLGVTMTEIIKGDRQ